MEIDLVYGSMCEIFKHAILGLEFQPMVCHVILDL